MCQELDNLSINQYLLHPELKKIYDNLDQSKNEEQDGDDRLIFSFVSIMDLRVYVSYSTSNRVESVSLFPYSNHIDSLISFACDQKHSTLNSFLQKSSTIELVKRYFNSELDPVSRAWVGRRSEALNIRSQTPSPSPSPILPNLKRLADAKHYKLRNILKQSGLLDVVKWYKVNINRKIQQLEEEIGMQNNHIDDILNF